MPRPKRWADLVPGLAALAALGLGVVGVLRFARVGSLRGETTRIYAAVSTARGVIAGTEVWLAGHQIGMVKDVVFRPPSLDTTSRVLLVLDVLERDRGMIHADADVRIRPGGSLIGVPVVALGTGSSRAPVARAGDTLVGRGPTYVERARADLAATAAQVPALVANLRLLALQLRSARGTLGALGATSAPAAMAATADAGNQLLQQALHGRGTIGRAIGGGPLAVEARVVMARVDSLRALLASPNVSVGRFRRDSTLLRTLETLRADVAELARRADSVDGTLGRAGEDLAIRQQLAQTRVSLDALIADFKRNPLRYAPF